MSESLFVAVDDALLPPGDFALDARFGALPLPESFSSFAVVFDFCFDPVDDALLRRGDFALVAGFGALTVPDFFSSPAVLFDFSFSPALVFGFFLSTAF